MTAIAQENAPAIRTRTQKAMNADPSFGSTMIALYVFGESKNNTPEAIYAAPAPQETNFLHLTGKNATKVSAQPTMNKKNATIPITLALLPIQTMS